LGLALAACAPDAPAPAGGDSADADGPLVIYAGRKDVLVGPLVERFRAETGLEIEVKYGTDAQLIATLQEEGAASPADLLWANTSGALAAADSLLGPAPDSLLARSAAFAPGSGRWVPLSVRFRTLAVAPGRVDTVGLPASVLSLPARADLRGRVGWTPTYSSFQDFVSALRAVHGDAAAQAWLDGMTALQPKAYESNTPMIEALAAGEIDVALTNHYYVMRLLHGGAGSAAPDVALHTFKPGDLGNLALVTGAGILRTSRRPAAAARFLGFLLSAEPQAFVASELHEYPVVGGTPVPPYLMPVERATTLGPALDPSQLTDLEGSLRMLRAADLL
jgi:iron(III) transport system substrate-binding protein